MANSALVKTLGYSTFHELASRNLESEGFDMDSPRSEFKRILERDGEVMGWESAWVRKDGSVVLVRENTRAVRREDGSVSYYEGTVEDITGYKQADKALRENLVQLAKKNRYETIIGSVTRSVHKSLNLEDVLENAVEAINENIEGVDNIFISLVEGKEAVLKSYRGYPGWFIERVRKIPYPKGATWKAIIEGKPVYCADADKDTAVLGPAGREAGTKSYVSMPVHLEGKAVGVININSLERNAFDEDELKLLEIVAQQIETALKNAKQAEALRESEERFRTFVEHSYDLIAETSMDGRFLYVSPKHKDMLGYEPEELLGRSVFEHVHADDRRSVLAEFQRAIMTFSSGNTVYRYRKKNGEWRWLESTGEPFKTATGELRGIIASRDITEQKRMEEEMLRAQKLESLGILAGGIAHDFNNMLTAILGNISLVKMCMDAEDKAHRRLSEAEKACLRASDLTRRLLTFSKGGAPVKRLISIGDLAKESANFAVRGTGMRCEFSIAEYVWPAEADEEQIRQVIHNLAINAVQAMPDGGVVKVTVENTVPAAGNGLPLKQGGYVKVSVKDNGIGIPEENLSRIFDPYFTTRQKGNGLGLAIAHSIIENHGGYIAVESAVGEGAEFSLYLPALQEEGIEENGFTEAAAGGKKKILVMDDEEVIREVAGEMLSRMGYEVEFARDGGEAIRLYERAKAGDSGFDAVIMDLTVPGGMGGREAVGRLLEIDPGVKAAASSGYSNDPVMSEFEKYGFKGVIAKPYRIEELDKEINKMINEG